MTPIVDGLEEQYQGQIAFQRFDANQGDGPAIIEAYQIMGHPTILVYDSDGQEIARLLGPQSAEALDEAIQQAIATTIQ